MSSTKITLANGRNPLVPGHGDRTTTLSNREETHKMTARGVHAKSEIPFSSGSTELQVQSVAVDMNSSAVAPSCTLQGNPSRETGGRFASLTKPLSALTPFLRAITKSRPGSFESPSGILHPSSPASNERRRSKNAVFPSSSLSPDLLTPSAENCSAIPQTVPATLKPNSKATASQLLALATSKAVKKFRPLISEHIDSTAPPPCFSKDNTHLSSSSGTNGNNGSPSHTLNPTLLNTNNNHTLPAQRHPLLEVKNGNHKPNSSDRNPPYSHHNSPDIASHIRPPQRLIPTRPIDPNSLHSKSPHQTKPAPPTFIKPKAIRSKLAHPNFGLHTGLQNHQPFPRTPRVCLSKQDYNLNSALADDSKPKPLKDNASCLAHSSQERLPKDLSPQPPRFHIPTSTPPDTPSSAGSKYATFIFTIPSPKSSLNSIDRRDGNHSLSSSDVFYSTSDSEEDPDNTTNLRKIKRRLARQNLLRPTPDKPPSKSHSQPELGSRLLIPPSESRRNSSAQLSPPEDVISDRPRRNSVWTAEVLSMEIQVDYNMDPDELWGNRVVVRNNIPVKDAFEERPALTFPAQTQAVRPPLDMTDPDNGDTFMRNEEGVKNGRVAEVGVVLPIIANSPSGGEDGDGDQDDKRSGNGDEQPPQKTPWEKLEMSDNPRGSGDSEMLNLPPREHWQNRFQFLLSTIGYAVDLSNVWRFPFLCYKNGGGAFLIPYFTTLIFGAMPVFFMEMCLGQFHRSGPVAVWEKMAPMFKGIGMASCFMSYIVAFYYNIIIGWSFFYLFSSFTSKLPWTSCFNSFNSPDCWQIDWDTNGTAPPIPEDHASLLSDSVTSASDWTETSTAAFSAGLNRTYNANTSTSSTMEFFERGMLEVHKSSGLEDLGPVRWQLVLCTMLTFTTLYFCLWKGVKSTGKVVYITATLPYLIMTILLIRGVLLPGAGNGIRYFITPKIESLRDPNVWIDAAVQIFFSVGSGFGTHIAYASYNKFHNNCKRDCMITVVVNSFTSLFSGFVIFSYLGYMSLKTHKDIDKVATEGPGLVFIVYPEAIATLPGSVGWSIIFFFMLLALGLDSAFGGLESPLTGLRDEMSSLLKYRYFREVLTLCVIASAFLFSLPCLTQGGIYVFTILDTFAAGTSIVFIVLCEVVAVSWFYGMPQFCKDVGKMTGEEPSIFWRICWKFICPTLLTVIVISSIISYQPLTFQGSQGVYTYPYYANIVGWCIACASMIMVPAYVVYKLIRTPGSFRQRLALGVSPRWEHEEIQRTAVVSRFTKHHWKAI